MKTNYFFLHLPKCGGISLRRLLAQDPFYFPIFSPLHVSQRAERYFSIYRGVGGHWPLRGAYRLGFKKAWKFTFLRDPMERLLSHLVFAALRDVPISDWDHLRADAAQIKAHLRKDLQSELPTYFNSYVSYLSTAIDERAPLDEHIASAIANLRDFEFVGHLDEFATDIDRLMSLLGLTAPAEVPRENVSRDHPRADLLKSELLGDAECRELLLQCIAGDQQIYEASLAIRSSPSGLSPELLAPPARPMITAGPTEGAKLQIVEATVTPGPSVLLGTALTFHVLLEIHAVELDFDLALAIESQPDGILVVHLLTYNQLHAHLHGKAGLMMVHFQMPSWLNKGYYVGHVKVFSESRANIAEKLNAFSFVVNTHDHPAQFGVLYADVMVTANDVDSNRRWPLEEARKLSLRFDPDAPIRITHNIYTIPLVLQNDSSLVACSTVDCRYYVSFHLVDATGKSVLFDGHRFPIPLTPAGATSRFVIDVAINHDLGAQKLQIRLIQEHVRWHEGDDFASQPPLDVVVN